MLGDKVFAGATVLMLACALLIFAIDKIAEHFHKRKIEMIQESEAQYRKNEEAHCKNICKMAKELFPELASEYRFNLLEHEDE